MTEKTQTCPVIELSSTYMDQAEPEMNADAFIQRPFDFTDVIPFVNSFIGHLKPQRDPFTKEFIFPVDNLPPGLPSRFYKQSDEH